MNAPPDAERRPLWRWTLLAILTGPVCFLAVTMCSNAGDKGTERSGTVTIVTGLQDKTAPSVRSLGNLSASGVVEHASERSAGALVADLAARFPDLHDIEITCAPDCALTARVALPPGPGVSSSPLPPPGEIEKFVSTHRFVVDGAMMVEEFAGDEWSIRLSLHPAP